MWQRFTERARAAVYFAQEEAVRRGISYVGPECLLLGLTQDADAVAVAVLRTAGVDTDQLRSRLETLLSEGTADAVSQASLTPSAKRVVELAYTEARARGCDYIGTEHLLLGIALEGGEVSGLLAELGGTADSLRAAISRLPSDEMKGDPVGAERVVEWLQSDALGLRGNSVLSIGDLSPEQLNGILICAEAFHRARRDGRRLVDWKGRKSLALLFEKASLRTRVTFELGMSELGGVPIVLGPSEVGLGKRESVGDVARNLDRWVSAVSARVYDHATLLEMHHCSSIPIINALSNREHPCQALADLQTLLQHKGRLDGLRIGWVGDGNNVLHSLMLGAAMMGASIAAACPPAYEPNPAVVSMARERAASGATVEIVNDPAEAVAGADAVYTDVWVSMGEEEEADVRRRVFEPYQVNEDLMRLARKDAVFMHCLPAHRGEEVTDAVLDGSHSVVLDQAENRLHAQKALLALTIGP